MIRVLLDAIHWNWLDWDRMEIYQQRICALIAIIACAHNTNSFNDNMNIFRNKLHQNFMVMPSPLDSLKRSAKEKKVRGNGLYDRGVLRFIIG